jgi:hypothetical protein
MSNGGSPDQHDDRKTVARKTPKAAAGKPVRGQVNRPSAGK